MKKLLLIVFVLAICILAFPQGVLADPAPVSRIITATYGSETTFNVDLVSPSGGWDWELVANDADDNEVTNALDFFVTSQSEWDVYAYGDYGTPVGYMWGSQGHLIAPLVITYGNKAGWGDLTTGSLLIRGEDPSADEVNWQESINQPVADNDKGSSTPFTTTVRFECVAAF